jgi:hypothetical protein
LTCSQTKIHEVIEAGDKLTVHVRLHLSLALYQDSTDNHCCRALHEGNHGQVHHTQMNTSSWCTLLPSPLPPRPHHIPTLTTNRWQQHRQASCLKSATSRNSSTRVSVSTFSRRRVREGRRCMGLVLRRGFGSVALAGA